MTKRFSDRLVLVTGAGGGLGRALAQGFAREGARLILTDVDRRGLAETAAALREQGTTSSTHSVDLLLEGEILKFAAEVCAKYEELHVLVNNAGIAYGEINQFETLGQEEWLRFLAVNSVAPLILGQALRTPLGRAKGVILNQSSMASYAPATAYGVSKAALNAMTYGMAQIFAADGIRVNAIAPGIVQTPASRDKLSPETYARIQGMQLLNTPGTAADIANLALFLASDEARFITREIVHCDAGNQLRGWRG